MIYRAVENANIEYIEVNIEGEIVYANRLFCSNHEFQPGKTNIFDIFIELTRHQWNDEWNWLKKGKGNKYDTFLMQLEGNAQNYEILQSYYEDEDKNFVSMYLNDIESRKLIEEELTYKGAHDSLTGLPNRRGMDKIIERMLKYEKGAVMFIDLDNFKRVNDIYGHETGDELLQIIANKIKDTIPENTILGRQSGDEFILVMNDIDDYHDAIKLAKKLTDTLKHPFSINGNIIYLSASIGTAFYPEHGLNRTAILSSADIAMYKAKTRGKARFVLYNNEMKYNLTDRHTMYLELQNALNNEEFEMYLQPIYNVDLSNIVIFESFIRWNHPKKGIIYPTQFIRLAEETGLITEIGKWIIKEMRLIIKKFIDNNIHKTCFSINLSLFQLDDPNFVSFINGEMEKSKIEHNKLYFELDEDLAQNISRTEVKHLKKLKDNGYRIAIHDFGYKFALMSILEKIKPDIIKINKMHNTIQDIDVQKQIILNLKTLTEYMDIELFCECVETKLQYDTFKDLGIKYMQGYHLGRPDTVDSYLNYTRGTQFG